MKGFSSTLILSLTQHFENVFMKLNIQRVRFHILLILIIKNARFNKFRTESKFKLHFYHKSLLYLAGNILVSGGKEGQREV